MTEIARRMGVAPQQLYPIARRLESEGAIVKNDKGYAPTNAKDDQVTV
jgi:Mn-dependent DtxR family transcriptional regulator